MPPKAKPLFKLTKSRRLQISQKLGELQLTEDWSTLFDAFARSTAKTDSWRNMVNGMLSVLGFATQERPKTWTQKIQLLVVAIVQVHSRSLDSLLGYSYESTFEKDNEDQSGVLHIPEFDNHLKQHVQDAMATMHTEDVICPNCFKPPMGSSSAKFCAYCGSSMVEEHVTPLDSTQPSVSSPPVVSDPILQSISAMVTAMDAQTKLLKQMTDKGKKSFYSGADEQILDLDEDLDTAMPSLWREPICSARECTKVEKQHSYALQQYIERSMVTTAMLIDRFKANTIEPKEERRFILQNLSESLRDQLQSYHVPGSRPMEAEKKALCCSLLKGRLPQKELEKVAVSKAKFNAPKDEKKTPKDEKPPYVRGDIKKKD